MTSSARAKFIQWRYRIIGVCAVMVLLLSIVPSNAIVPVLGSSGPITKGTWTNIALTGMPNQANIGLELSTTSLQPFAFASREDITHAPQLVVTSSSGSTTTVAEADTSVTNEHPLTNYGTSPWLFAEASRDIRTYVKFTLPASVLTSTSRVYTLRLFVLVSNPVGITVRRTGTAWVESGAYSVTYKNRPLLIDIPDPTIVVLPSTINTKCAVDVTANIQNAINALPSGKTLQFQPGACYRVNGTLRLTQKSNVAIDGNGSTLRQTTNGDLAPDPRTRAMFVFEGGSNIAARNLTIRGANPSTGLNEDGYVVEREGQHGFSVLGTQGVLLENNSVYNVYGDAVYFGVLKETVFVKNAVLRGNHLESMGRQGVSVVGGDDILIENNYIGYSRHATLDIEPNNIAGAIHRLTFQNNDIGPGRLLFVANYGAPAPMEDIKIVNNKLTGKPMQIWVSDQGAGLNNRKRYTISGNTSDTQAGEPSGASLQFQGVSDLVVSNNVSPQQRSTDRTMSLVLLQRVNGARVVNNNIPNGIASMKLVGTANTNLCSSGNYIGSPLTKEPSSGTC